MELNQDAIRRVNDNSLTGKHGDIIAADARANLNRFDAEMPSPDTLEEAQREYLERRRTEWQSLVQEAYADQLRREASFVPWYIAGPSNYPAARANKQFDRNRRAADDYSGKMKRFMENTRRELERLESPERQIARYKNGHSAPVQMGDPFALEKLAARLQYLEDEQRTMRRVNAHYRKHKTCVGCEGFSPSAAARLDDSARANLYGVPYAPWALQNNNQNIHRIKLRLEELRRLKEVKNAPVPNDAKEDDNFPYHVTQNADLARLQVRFDGMPDADTRALLKQNGFRWSPREKAWQRQLTANARYALERIKPQLAKAVVDHDRP